MRITISPGNAIIGEVRLSGDKSISHRAALLSAIANGESRVQNFLVAGVTQAMLRAIRACGISWELQGTTLTVHGKGLRGLSAPAEPLDCGNSATTIRLLAGMLVAAGIPAVLDGTPSLRRRPMGRIVEPLRAMGAAITSQDGHPPLKLEISTQPLQAIDYSLPVASAQVKTCLMLAGLTAQGTTILREPGPSRDHTERMLRSLGVRVDQEMAAGETAAGLYITRLTGSRQLQLKPFELELPGDISAASFLIVAALITPGSHLLVKDVLLNPTRTGLLDALDAMGASIRRVRRGERCGEPVGDLEIRHSPLKGIEISGSLVVRMIDEFPAFSVACVFAKGRSVVRDAEELRHKESDRISSMCAELRALGCAIDETKDGFSISGGRKPAGGVANSHGDHRLAMALALVGLASSDPVEVRGAEIIKESFPDFVGVLRSLGGNLEVIEP